MKILIIRKDSLAQLPPLLSVACILRDLGHEVHVVTSEFSPSIIEVLNSKGITFEVLNHSGGTSFVSKVYQYIRYRHDAKKLISTKSFDLLWIEGGHTILALGTFIKKYKFVLQISELYDLYPRIIKAISKVIHNATVVFMPEYNRSVLYQIWFKLYKRPVVLPNKPYFIPTSSDLDRIADSKKEILSKLNGKKIILYQGYIHPERDLSNFIAAARDLGPEWVFVVLGRDQYGLLDKYKKINKNLIHIGFIPAPDYLCITRLARIGILTYDPMLHNTAYCAPNKIFEYGSFSVPMIGNNIPGLNILKEHGAGILVNENNIESIKSAYKTIDNNHDAYSMNAKALYESINNISIIESALLNI